MSRGMGRGGRGSRWRGGRLLFHAKGSVSSGMGVGQLGGMAPGPWRHSEKRGKRERLTVGDPLSEI